MFALHLTQGHHVYTMCPDIIFQILLPYSRPMTSHHMTCHVTAISCAFSSSIKEKEIQKKRNIKPRKINKRTRKMLVSKVFYNSTPLLGFCFQRNFFFVLPNSPTYLFILLVPFSTFFQLSHIFFFTFLSIILLSIPIFL